MAIIRIINPAIRTNQPVRPVRADRGNYYGRYLHWTWMPGWNPYHLHWADGRPMSWYMEANVRNSGATTFELTSRNYSWWGNCVAWKFVPASSTNITHFHNIENIHHGDLGEREAYSICVLHRPVNPSLGVDSRIISKDSGTAVDDHDFMLGNSSGNSYLPRCRLRSNLDNTDTIILAGGWENNAINMQCAGFHESRETCTNFPQSFPNIEENTASPGTNAARTRTTTDFAIGATAASTTVANPYGGEIIAIFCFLKSFDHQEQRYGLFHNPWQIFESDPILFGPAAVAALGSLPAYKRRGTKTLRRM